MLRGSLQEDLVNLISNFYANISSQRYRQHRSLLQWEDIESKLTNIRQKIVKTLKGIFFDPFVEVKDHSGHTHYVCKLCPKILTQLMFAFDQRWIYEEAGEEDEQTNFKAMEKLIT